MVANSDSTAEKGSNTTPEIFGSAAYDTGTEERTGRAAPTNQAACTGTFLHFVDDDALDDDDDALLAAMPSGRVRA